MGQIGNNNTSRLDQRKIKIMGLRCFWVLKGFLRVVLFGLMLTSLLGCGRPAKSADEVAEIFFQAMTDRDFQKAAEFVEPHTSAFLRLAHSMAEAQRETGELLDLPLGGVVLSSAQIINEHQASIQVERNHRIEQVTLVRIEGHWRVRLPESIF
jgi:hypothetical protein